MPAQSRTLTATLQPPPPPMVKVKSDGVTEVLILAKVAAIGSNFVVVNHRDDKNLLRHATVMLDKLSPQFRKHVLHTFQKARDNNKFVSIPVTTCATTVDQGSTHPAHLIVWLSTKQKNTQ